MSNLKKKKPKRYASIGKIQEITWRDHSSYKGWIDPKALKPEIIAKTIGQVGYEDRNYVQIASTTCAEDQQVGMVMNIIKSCILKRRTLK